MWEVFLFVNPLGLYCLNTENRIIDFVNKNNIQAHYNFIAINNLNNVTDFMKRKNLDTSDLALRNQITLNCYDAALTYKAASCQGQKKARKLLMGLQDSINNKNIPYSDDLVKSLTDKYSIDYNELISDKNCELVNTSFESDQLLAREMHATETPSTVIFNYDLEDQNGILINNCSENELEEILLDIVGTNSVSNNKNDNLINISFYQK